MNTLKHFHSYIQLFFYLTAILTLTLTVQSLVICHLNIAKASHLVLGTSYLRLSDPIFALASLFSQTQIWPSDLSTEYSFIAPIVFRVKFKLSIIKVLCDLAPAYHIIYLQFPYVGHVLFCLQPFVHASFLIYNACTSSLHVLKTQSSFRIQQESSQVWVGYSICILIQHSVRALSALYDKLLENKD